MRFLKSIDVVDFGAGRGGVPMLLDCAVDDPVVSVRPFMELSTPVWTAPIIYG
jgi:hypothetical protein